MKSLVSEVEATQALVGGMATRSDERMAILERCLEEAVDQLDRSKQEVERLQAQVQEMVPKAQYEEALRGVDERSGAADRRCDDEVRS